MKSGTLNFKRIRDEVLEDVSVRLWREVFDHAPLKRFSPHVQGWISRGRNSCRQNLSRKFKDLVREMQKAGMTLSDAKVLVYDIDLEVDAVFGTTDISLDAIHEASRIETLHNNEEDLAQQRLDQELTISNAEDYVRLALKAKASRDTLLVLARRYAKQKVA